MNVECPEIRCVIGKRKEAGDEFAGMGCWRGASRWVGVVKARWARNSNVLQYFRISTGD